MDKQSKILNQLKEDAMSGNLNNTDKETLYKYSSILCLPKTAQNFSGIGQYTQICESVRNNILRVHMESLQSHITGLDSKNTSLQKWVIVLAVAALVSTVVQTTIAIRGELREESKMQEHLIKQKKIVLIKEQPIHVLHQKTNPISKK